MNTPNSQTETDLKLFNLVKDQIEKFRSNKDSSVIPELLFSIEVAVNNFMGEKDNPTKNLLSPADWHRMAKEYFLLSIHEFSLHDLNKGE